MQIESEALTRKQDRRFRHPELGVDADLDAVYEQDELQLGWPEGEKRIFYGLARKHTVVIVGLELGDEGKGRMVDNKLETLLDIEGISKVHVIRYQGGSNAGHSVESHGRRIALHQIPSGVFYPQAVGIMDQGMAVHPEDLRTEIEGVEAVVGDLRAKLYLSESAILCTDLERAEELLNRKKQGKAKGGTGRGISPSFAHHYDRLGAHVHDLLADNWRETLGPQYDRYQREFALYEMPLAHVAVPDLKATRAAGGATTREVGTREDFLDRLDNVRAWLLERDMVRNTFLMHKRIADESPTGVLFEGAQALGLHPWLGTRPDVTSSDTSVDGVKSGTGFWRAQDIADRIGVFKLTYTSSVGARRMPTQADPEWENWVREEAHEYGTTTGRPRDILYLDLPLLIYNARLAGIEVLAGTHLDIAREDKPVRVCTHYTRAEVPAHYQPGVRSLMGITPHYVELPGWDGSAVQGARSLQDLPENAVRYLALIQRRTGYPIVAVSTGPARSNFIRLPGYEYEG